MSYFWSQNQINDISELTDFHKLSNFKNSQAQIRISDKKPDNWPNGRILRIITVSLKYRTTNNYAKDFLFFFDTVHVFHNGTVVFPCDLNYAPPCVALFRLWRSPPMQAMAKPRSLALAAAAEINTFDNRKKTLCSTVQQRRVLRQGLLLTLLFARFRGRI